ncbi:MAG TPA: outer membrane beta-barrel protein [Niabella sp.]|nr:outer membrane beta-barrel protein [Niabella sp.]
MNSSFLFGQVKDTLLIGEVKGVITDTAYRFKLKSATVAVYLKKDSSLIQYQLSNTIGAFHFSKLPLEVPLYLVASYVGYEDGSVSFIIPGSGPKTDLKTVALKRNKGELLPEVIVKYIPPVRMNGDTLEFNADAFKLDKSAVVEDLLRKLPGVTVWGDGAITVNGKEVSGVKVDGKPFFTGDPKIALQNLPKDAVEKIQVYKKFQNSLSRSDSLNEINIKLKNNKNFGGFGKAGIGTNFNNRNEAEVSFNLFNPRSQAGIVWAKNNINKIPKDVNTILRNATYKGISNSLEYSPDFELAGINRSHAGGFIFQHDFIAAPGLDKNNRVNGGYFLQNLQSELKEYAKTRVAIDGTNYQEQLDTAKENVRRINHSLYTHYNLRKKGKIFDLDASFKRAVNDRDAIQTSSTYNNEGDLLNRGLITNKSSERTNNASLGINGEQAVWTNKNYRFPKKFTYSYSVAYGERIYQGIRRSEFIALSDEDDNRLYNRSYNKSSNTVDQSLGFTIGNLTPLLFGNRMFSRIETTIINDLKVFNSNENNKVADWDSTDLLYKKNAYLSNKGDYIAVTEKPAIRLNRNFSMNLANRYFKTLSVALFLRGAFFWQKNNSDQIFQVFQKGYSDFTPSANLSFNNYQLGRHHNLYQMSYARTVGYPTPAQLVPLVDSSNSYFIISGNPDLKRYEKDEISFNISHETFAKNVFNYAANVAVGKIANVVGDHITIDDIGRRVQYPVNLDGYRYFLAGGNLKKLLRFKNNQLQFSFHSQLNFTNSPNVINGRENISLVTTKDAGLSLYYSFKELLGFELKQSYFNYSSKQSNAMAATFKSQFWITSFAGTVQFTKKLRLCSDVQYKNNSTSFSDPIHYTIWNAHVILRILESKNLECKFSALDLLGQNNVLNNTGNNNLITQSLSNSLQRYYMLTLAFYPRKFGKANRTASTE